MSSANGPEATQPPFVVIRGVSIILRLRDAKTRARDRGAVRVGNRRWRFNCDDLSSLQRLVLRGARTQRTRGARGQCEQRPRTLPSLTLECELVSSRVYVVHLYHVHVHTELTLNRPVL